jgi:primase-polymerase (primpol)-like protein
MAALKTFTPAEFVEWTDEYLKELPRAEAKGPAPEPVGLEDEDLLRHMFSSRNARKVKALWDGDISIMGGDNSSCDQALANILTWWCNHDMPRVERLFGLSKPAERDKWQTRPDYRSRTLAQADGWIAGGYQPKRRTSPPPSQRNEATR